MPIQITEENAGKTLVIRVSGKLTKADFAAFTPEIDRLVAKHGKLRVLFDFLDFHGWEPGGLWEELKFDLKHLSHLERLAAVGEKRWQHGLTTICGPFTRAPVRYFDHADAAEARKWLDEAPDVPSE